MSEKVDDPLKDFDQILVPDVRSSFFSIVESGSATEQGALERHHREVANIQLHDNAPRNVRQLFETAKNLALYSWFVYRFHQPAELCAFGAVEMALREKAKLDAPDWWNSATENRNPPLSQLLREAHTRGWLLNEEFALWRRHQQMAAWQSANYRQIEEMIRLGINEAESPRLEDFEGELGDPAYDYVSVLTNVIPSLRNNLAHGSITLHPDSLGTLCICAELINALF